MDEAGLLGWGAGLMRLGGGMMINKGMWSEDR